MAAATKTKGNYIVLSNLHHQDEDVPRGKVFRRGDQVKLSDADAAPLLKTKVVEPAK